MYINVQEDYGRAYGFNCELFDSRFEGFIEKHGLELTDELKMLLTSNLPSNLTLLNHIKVSQEHKNQGFGTILLNEFTNRSNGCILIVSDANEQNSFDLTKWYEKNGFITLTETKYGPLMFKVS